MVAAAAAGKHMSRNITDFFKPSMSNQEEGSILHHGFAWSAIKEINKVEEAVEKIWSKRAIISAENKVKIARYASENRVTASLSHFK